MGCIKDIRADYIHNLCCTITSCNNHRCAVIAVLTGDLNDDSDSDNVGNGGGDSKGDSHIYTHLLLPLFLSILRPSTIMPRVFLITGTSVS